MKSTFISLNNTVGAYGYNKWTLRRKAKKRRLIDLPMNMLLELNYFKSETVRYFLIWQIIYIWWLKNKLFRSESADAEPPNLVYQILQPTYWQGLTFKFKLEEYGSFSWSSASRKVKMAAHLYTSPIRHYTLALPVARSAVPKQCTISGRFKLSRNPIVARGYRLS